MHRFKRLLESGMSVRNRRIGEEGYYHLRFDIDDLEDGSVRLGKEGIEPVSHATLPDLGIICHPWGHNWLYPIRADRIKKEVSAIITAVFFFLLISVTPGIAMEKELLELHKNADNSKNEECLACHDSILRKDGLPRKKLLAFHKVHLESKLQTPKICVYCHQFPGLKGNSASPSREPVDPRICARCH